MTSHASWSTGEGWGPADEACLQVIIQACLILSVPLCVFFSPAFSQRRGLQPHLVLINNTGALSKRGVMAERTKSEVKWKKKRMRRRRKQDKLTRQVSCCETHGWTNEKEKGGMSTGNYRHTGGKKHGKDDLGNRDPPWPLLYMSLLPVLRYTKVTISPILLISSLFI